MEQIQLDIKDVQMLLGEKDLIIFQLQKEIARLQQTLAENKDFDKPYSFPKEVKES